MDNGKRTTSAAKGPGEPLRPAGRTARAGSGQHDAVPCLLGHDVPVRHLDGLVRGNAGASVAADHLLGVHSAVRLLCALWATYAAARCYRVCRRSAGNGDDAGVHAGKPGHFWCADLSGQRHAAHRCAGTAAEKDPARRRAGGFGGAVCTDLSSGRALARLRRAAPCVAGCMVRELLYSVYRLSALRFLFHRLFCPAAVAVFVLGRVLSARRGGPGADGTAAPFGLPGTGLDGAALAFAVSAAPAGDLRRTFGRGSSFCIKGLTQPGSCGILSVVRRY